MTSHYRSRLVPDVIVGNLAFGNARRRHPAVIDRFTVRSHEARLDGPVNVLVEASRRTVHEYGLENIVVVA